MGVLRDKWRPLQSPSLQACSLHWIFRVALVALPLVVGWGRLMVPFTRSRARCLGHQLGLVLAPPSLLARLVLPLAFSHYSSGPLGIGKLFLERGR